MATRPCLVVCVLVGMGAGQRVRACAERMRLCPACSPLRSRYRCPTQRHEQRARVLAASVGGPRRARGARERACGSLFPPTRRRGAATRRRPAARALHARARRAATRARVVVGRGRVVIYPPRRRARALGERPTSKRIEFPPRPTSGTVSFAVTAPAEAREKKTQVKSNVTSAMAKNLLKKSAEQIAMGQSDQTAARQASPADGRWRRGERVLPLPAVHACPPACPAARGSQPRGENARSARRPGRSPARPAELRWVLPPRRGGGARAAGGGARTAKPVRWGREPGWVG